MVKNLMPLQLVNLYWQDEDHPEINVGINESGKFYFVSQEFLDGFSENPKYFDHSLFRVVRLPGGFLSLEVPMKNSDKYTTIEINETALELSPTKHILIRCGFDVV